MTQVAIVHDYLTQRGGAERVVLALHEAFPSAPIHTALYDRENTFDEFATADVRPLAIDRSTRLRRSHRLAFPLLAPSFSSLRVDADIVICSSSGWAHGARTDGRKLVYCYTPARWLYQSDRYVRSASRSTKAVVQLSAPLLRHWDRRQAATADGYAAISNVVASRIRSEYQIEPTLIPPPVTVDPDGSLHPIERITGDFDLCVSRLLSYKNVDALIGASARVAGHRLVVVGDGPDGQRLRELATDNVVFLPQVTEPELRWLYATCRFLLTASHEDFGLTPLEAASFGKPSLVLRFGGFLDTVLDRSTGLFFDEPQPSLIAAAISEASSMRWDESAIRSQARRFSPDAFQSLVADWTGITLPQLDGPNTTIGSS